LNGAALKSARDRSFVPGLELGQANTTANAAEEFSRCQALVKADGI